MPNPLQLSVAPNINPMSSTGSDLLDQSIGEGFSFGDISFGPKPVSGWQKVARDVAVGVAVAFVANLVAKRFLK